MIVGCYSLDLYCENAERCGANGSRYGEHTPATFAAATWPEAAKEARSRGWRISRDRERCWCARCVAEKADR